ncbi:phospholipase D-like domain-containing protein [Microbacterium sp. BK668]|uniref:phospholipase D-like domain-containing protein n=1 Tax=Microbacterium sp. BK668 TaxID=2512118 RepID=UPI001060F3B8|nr:phospholipase D-like domain-containing protein [Microbacterium sp. BK668]TDN91924.1 phosphatidylserine/phosphatidylglycerophosphate/cardiolipin synthase-like enzyme [Microbacterium sp. BK668]
MVNTSVSGRVVDTTGAPQPGLNVRVYDDDGWPFRDFLQQGATDSVGAFSLTYPAEAYGLDERRPDVVVEIRSTGGSLLFVTKKATDVAEEVLQLGDITLSGVNVGVQGRVLDVQGRPIAGLVIVATDLDLIGGDPLGRTATDADGRWSLSYSPTVYNELSERPDIVVTVFDRVGIRQLAQTSEARNVAESVLVVKDIVVPRAAAEGWLVTLGRSNTPRLSSGNDVEVLVDNAIAARRLVELIDAATTEVHLAQLAIDTGFIATFTGQDPVPTNATHADSLVLDSLFKAGQRPGVTVRVLLNENAIVPDTIDEVRDWFAQRAPHTVSVRSFPLTFETMHAKILITDPGLPTARAMIIGSPFEQGYWDTPSHLLVDPRRGSHGASGIGLRPVHDVSISMTGPATADIARTFSLMWNHRSDVAFRGADKLPSIVQPPAVGSQSVQIVRSIPQRAIPATAKGEAGVLEAYQRAIGAATDVIYLENQYFSSGEAVHALRRALAVNPSLQVILLINQSPDIPTYRRWQQWRMVGELGMPHPQIGAFTLWQIGPVAGKTGIQQVYVHSKVGIVDTSWATVGTANLDGISLEGARELYRGDKRSVEVNAVLLDGVADQPATGAVGALRSRLWSEHLGPLPASRPPQGWLSLWQERAAANVASLSLNSPRMSRGRILPYRFETKDADQLAGLGIDTSRMVVLD